MEGKPIGNILLLMRRCKLEENIRINLKEMRVNKRNSVDLSSDSDHWRALVNAALKLRVP